MVETHECLFETTGQLTAACLICGVTAEQAIKEAGAKLTAQEQQIGVLVKEVSNLLMNGHASTCQTVRIKYPVHCDCGHDRVKNLLASLPAKAQGKEEGA